MTCMCVVLRWVLWVLELEVVSWIIRVTSLIVIPGSYRRDINWRICRGRSVPTVTELIFVRVQCFYQLWHKSNLRFADFQLREGFYQLCHKINLLFPDLQLDHKTLLSVGSPQSVNCFYVKVGKNHVHYRFFTPSHPPGEFFVGGVKVWKISATLVWFLTKSQTLKPNLILLTNHLSRMSAS
jgi:hypothetical protein